MILKFGFCLRTILLVRDTQKDKLLSRSNSSISVLSGEVKLPGVHLEDTFLAHSFIPVPPDGKAKGLFFSERIVLFGV